MKNMGNSFSGSKLFFVGYIEVHETTLKCNQQEIGTHFFDKIDIVMKLKGIFTK